MTTCRSITTNTDHYVTRLYCWLWYKSVSFLFQVVHSESSVHFPQKESLHGIRYSSPSGGISLCNRILIGDSKRKIYDVLVKLWPLTSALVMHKNKMKMHTDKTWIDHLLLRIRQKQKYQGILDRIIVFISWLSIMWLYKSRLLWCPKDRNFKCNVQWYDWVCLGQV